MRRSLRKALWRRWQMVRIMNFFKNRSRAPALQTLRGVRLDEFSPLSLSPMMKLGTSPIRPVFGVSHHDGSQPTPAFELLRVAVRIVANG